MLFKTSSNPSDRWDSIPVLPRLTVLETKDADPMPLLGTLPSPYLLRDNPLIPSFPRRRYFRPNKNRPNLKVLCEAHASKIVLNGNTATGVEFIDPQGKKHVVKASKEVILSGGVIGTPQLLELSGIGDPEVLKAAGVECLVENKAVGANFQDHVLGGMLYDLKPGIESLDSMNNAEFAKAATEQYEKTQNGPLGSPGMLMGFVSYASLVGKEQLEKTIKEIRANSHAKTDFEKRQEDLIVRQLSDDTFANIQTFCE